MTQFKDLDLNSKLHICKHLNAPQLLALAQNSSVDFIVAIYTLAIKFNKPFDQEFVKVFNQEMRILLTHPDLWNQWKDLRNLLFSILSRIQEEASSNPYAMQMLPLILVFRINHDAKTDQIINLAQLLAYHSKAREPLVSLLYHFSPDPNRLPSAQIAAQRRLYREGQQVVHLPSTIRAYQRQLMITDTWQKQNPSDLVAAALTAQEKQFLINLLMNTVEDPSGNPSDKKHAMSEFHLQEGNIDKAFKQFLDIWQDPNYSRNGIGGSVISLLLPLFQNPKHTGLRTLFIQTFLAQTNINAESDWKVEKRTLYLIQALKQLPSLLGTHIDVQTREALLPIIIHLLQFWDDSLETEDQKINVWERLHTAACFLKHTDFQSDKKILDLLTFSLNKTKNILETADSIDLYLQQLYFNSFLLKQFSVNHPAATQLAHALATYWVAVFQPNQNIPYEEEFIFLAIEYLGSLSGLLLAGDRDENLVSNIITILHVRSVPDNNAAENAIQNAISSLALCSLLRYIQYETVRKLFPDLASEIGTTLLLRIPNEDYLDAQENITVTAALARILPILLEKKENQPLVTTIINALTTRIGRLINAQVACDGFYTLQTIMPQLLLHPHYDTLSISLVMFLINEAKNVFGQAIVLDILEKIVAMFDANPTKPSFFPEVVTTLRDNFGQLSFQAQVLVIRNFSLSEIDHLINRLITHLVHMGILPNQASFDKDINLLTSIALLYPEKTEAIVNKLKEHLSPLVSNNFTETLDSAPICIPRAAAQMASVA